MRLISRASSRTLLTVLAALLVATASALAGAGAAGAHAALIASDPADGAELTRPPASVSATFNEEMQPRFAAMTVIGPDGNNWAAADPQVDGAVITVGVRTLDQSGTYTVNYRATSADGHVVTGSWSFRLTVAGAATPAPPPPQASPAADPPAVSSDDGIPVWPFYAAAVVIVGAGAVWAVRRRR